MSDLFFFGVTSPHLPIASLSFMALFTLRAVLFGVTGLVWTQKSKWAQENQIYTKEKIPLSWHLDFGPALRSLTIDSLLVGLAVWLGWFRIKLEGELIESVLVFIGFFVWYEVYFYYTHRWMHHPKLFWIHRLHHARRATNAATSLMFSTTERLILIFGAVGLPGLVSQFHVLPAASVSFYFLVNYILNVYEHLNVELLPSPLAQGKVGRWMATANSHSLHHQTYRGNYGLFTQVLDRLHGTQIHQKPVP